MGQLNVPELNNVSDVKLIEDSIRLMTKFEPETIRSVPTLMVKGSPNHCLE